MQEIWYNYITGKKEICKEIRELKFVYNRCLIGKIKFTAKNFVPLDWTLMHTVLAAVATYVVILVQFEI